MLFKFRPVGLETKKLVTNPEPNFVFTTRCHNSQVGRNWVYRWNLHVTQQEHLLFSLITLSASTHATVSSLLFALICTLFFFP